MPTVAELARWGAPLGIAVHHAGGAGLARDVELPIAGMLVAPGQDEQLALSWLAQRQVLEERLTRDLTIEFGDLAHAGATMGDVITHLACLTGKVALLHDATPSVRVIHQPGNLAMSRRVLRSAIGVLPCGETTRTPWSGGGVDAVEVPGRGLLRLTVALCPGTPTAQYISLLGEPAAITQRDRIALAAAARAVSDESVEVCADGEERLARSAAVGCEQTHFGLAIEIPPGAHAVDVGARVARLVGSRQLLVRFEKTRLICIIAAGRPALEDWERHDLIESWHSALCAEFGPISLGYSGVHVGEAAVHESILEAHRALVVGNRISSPGHPHAYADVAMRSFLLHWHEPEDLQALHETLLGPILAHDRVAEQQLLPTLQVYLDSACAITHAADRLGIHRNSMMYRLRRIEAIAKVDLGDADIRLMLQLAMRAKRVMVASPRR